MLYKTITVGESLKNLETHKHFPKLSRVDFDYLVNLAKDEPTLLFIDSAHSEKSTLDDWLYAFTNIILINNSPIRAFLLKGNSEKENTFNNYYRIIGDKKPTETIARKLLTKIEKELSKLSGKSRPIIELKKMLILSMFYEGSVLFLGETGTGKNLVAEIMVNLSPRWDKSFYSLNCAAIPDTLLESELFGYKKGAFTGATSEKTGLIEQAHEGTLFLDEIGDMPQNLQAKILSVTENREFFKIGSTESKKVNLRFLTATNRTEDTVLRNDLRYRLSAIQITIPPLRDRKSDIPVIVDNILKNKGYLLRFESLPEDIKKLLLDYSYPGNVRELINMIEEYLAVNNIMYFKDIKGLDQQIKTLANKAVTTYVTDKITYKNFLENIHDRITKELLEIRFPELEFNIKKLSEEFGLTPRRIRDLLNKHELKKPEKE
ncbi:MAG: sigma-54-dependent Fis family transcriptional regulator [Kosmotoga sp.]|nr:MAG: sigma-54-dependent Fis family transcriptional regulator [Kosmotoga sp.]